MTVGRVGPNSEQQLDLGIDRKVSDTPNPDSDFTSKICDQTGDGNGNGFPATYCVSDGDCSAVRDRNGNPQDAGPCVAVGRCSDNRGTKCWNKDKGLPFGFGDGCGTCDLANVSNDPNGGGELSDQGPKYQPADRYFGPGTVNIMKIGFVSQRDSCQDGGDAEWCVFPGISTTCVPPPAKTCHSGPQVGAACNSDADCGGGGGSCAAGVAGQGTSPCTDANTYALREPVSYGIVGCYEFADGNPTDKGYPTIDWPYIGPPIFKDQLQAFYLHMDSNLYSADAQGREADGNGNPAGTDHLSPTNPHQDVRDNCNDEGDDSHVDNHFCYLTSANNWEADCNDRGGGQDKFKMSFDDNGKLISLKVVAKDDSDEGTFGIRSIGFMFEPFCAVLDRVDVAGEFGLTRADTEAVNSQRNFLRPSAYSGITDPAPVNTTTFAQACTPWGSVGWQTQDPATSLDQGTRWTVVALYPDAPTACATDLDCPTSKKCMPGGWCAEAAANDCSEIASRHASSYTTSPYSTLVKIGATLATPTQPLLFRESFGAWQWNGLDGHSVNFDGSLKSPLYHSIASAAAPFYNNTSNPAGVVPPHIASVDTARCSSDGHCPVKTLDHITMNGRDNGVISAQGAVYQANVQFYAWASSSQMPVKLQRMVWGDNAATEPPARGWYKNQKPYCSPDSSDQNAIGQCIGGGVPPGLTCRSGQSQDCPNSTCSVNGNHFGNTPGACNAAPLKFDHTYTCSLADLQGLRDCSATGGFDPVTDRAIGAPCKRKLDNIWNCVYRPAVQIIDNWGWCNCTGGASVCDATVAGGKNDSAGACSNAAVSTIKTNGPWTAFDGEVRLETTDLESALFDAAGGGPLPPSVFGYIGGTVDGALLPPNFRAIIVNFNNP